MFFFFGVELRGWRMRRPAGLGAWPRGGARERQDGGRKKARKGEAQEGTEPLFFCEVVHTKRGQGKTRSTRASCESDNDRPLGREGASWRGGLEREGALRRRGRGGGGEYLSRCWGGGAPTSLVLPSCPLSLPSSRCPPPSLSPLSSTIKTHRTDLNTSSHFVQSLPTNFPLASETKRPIGRRFGGQRGGRLRHPTTLSTRQASRGRELQHLGRRRASSRHRNKPSLRSR